MFGPEINTGLVTVIVNTFLNESWGKDFVFMKSRKWSEVWITDPSWHNWVMWMFTQLTTTSQLSFLVLSTSSFSNSVRRTPWTSAACWAPPSSTSPSSSPSAPSPPPSRSAWTGSPSSGQSRVQSHQRVKKGRFPGLNSKSHSYRNSISRKVSNTS